MGESASGEADGIMAEIRYKLDVFEGPLDLLLHLISKHKLNINDIPISSLVDQYLEYITDISDDMEYAGEFLEMAARLIYIKTVSLLPQREEGEKLKKELEGRLIEYSAIKLCAAALSGMYTDTPYCVREPLKIDTGEPYSLHHSTAELLAAYGALGRKAKGSKINTAPFQVIVSKRFVSVTTKMVYILKNLYQTGECTLKDIFSDMTDRSERVAAFLAVLELTRNGRILLNEDNTRITFSSSEYSEDIFSDFDSDGAEESDTSETLNTSEQG